MKRSLASEMKKQSILNNKAQKNPITKPSVENSKANSKSVPKNSQKINVKKSSKSNISDSAKKSKKTIWIILSIAFIGIILAIILFWSAWPKNETSSNDVMARVNSIPITTSAFNFQYNLLPETYRKTFSQGQVLEQIIDEELVVQAARKDGLNASLQEVNERVQKVLGSSGITLSELQDNLDRYNITQQQFEMLVERQILIERYLSDKIVISPVDDATAMALYNSTKEQFALPEQVTVRHILVAAQRTNAALLSKNIYDSVKSGADFCTFVKNSSDDKGSRDTCGVYTFPRGFMVPEFEKASFDMVPGEYRMVQTSFGYHVINKINSTPASIKPFSAVKSQIIDQIQSADRAQQYRKIVTDLRSVATVAYANGTVIMPQELSSMSAGKVSNDPLLASNDSTGNGNDSAGSAVPSPSSANGVAVVNAAGSNSSDSAKAVPDAVPAVSDAGTQTVPTANNATAGPSNDSAANFVQNDNSGLPSTTEQKLACISKHSTLYGMPWSSDSQSARDLFAKANVSLNYVDCGTSDCKTQGVKAYPTWKIDGVLIMGKMSVDELASQTGC